MSDLISRQAAIDALKEKVFHNLTDEFYGAMQVLDELPSAQPEIIRCKDCYLRYTSCPMVVRHGNALLFFSKDEDFCSYGKGEEE